MARAPSPGAGETATSVAGGHVSAAEIAAAALDRAAAVDAGDAGLNVFVHMDAERTLAYARNVDADVARGTAPAPLTGVPFALKDNIATHHFLTTCGSRILEGYVSPFEATAMARLRAAGAVCIGKTNMDEFAMGSSTEHSAYGPTRNPLDPSRVPGGSSGGSAAAVAAGVVPIALGSETGGSVRQPAAFCGVVGVKPTWGRVSRYGLVAFASSLDHIGVVGRTVADAALGLGVIAGHDPYDATSAPIPVPDYVAATQDSLDGFVIGRPREYFPASLDPRIGARCDAALGQLEAAGAKIRDVSLPHTELAIPVYYVVAPAEASSNLARFDGVRFGRRATAETLRGMYDATRSEGFGPEVTRRILLGTYVLSAGYYDAYYRKAMQIRSLISQDFRHVFASGVHLVLTPTTPSVAFPLGAISDPYEMYLSDIFTAPANLAGIPAISVPAGIIDGLPIGVQLMAPHFEEARMFTASAAIERAMTASPLS